MGGLMLKSWLGNYAAIGSLHMSNPVGTLLFPLPLGQVIYQLCVVRLIGQIGHRNSLLPTFLNCLCSATGRVVVAVHAALLHTVLLHTVRNPIRW